MKKMFILNCKKKNVLNHYLHEAISYSYCFFISATAFSQTTKDLILTSTSATSLVVSKIDSVQIMPHSALLKRIRHCISPVFHRC